MWWLAIIAALGLLGVLALASEPDGREQLVIAADAWNQCSHVEARVNGHVFKNGLLDTGAAGHLLFGSNHARDLGFDPAKLSYDHRYDSANGEGRYALVRVREFQLGSFVARDLPAKITAAPQNFVLVGIDLLRSLNLQLKDGHCLLTLPPASEVTAR
jgi:clan AA aspartic protease (TIGR02281 family)